MSQIESEIRRLVQQRLVVVSQHAMGRIAKRNIVFTAIIAGVQNGEVIEHYATYHAGPALLMLQRDGQGDPIHVVWGIEKGTTEPAVIVTAYRPDPTQWSADFRKRKP
jgi:predicted cobalt transporter CbtA